MEVGATRLVTLLAAALAVFFAGAAFAGPVDSDGDGILDADDNCPATFNPTQANSDVTTDPPGDPHGDACDNCRDTCNVLQIDTNSDGCGNRCDPDYDDSGAVSLPDFGAILSNFGLTSPPVSPDIDTTGGPGGCTQGIGAPDGSIALPDFGLLLAFFGSPPGPGIPPDTDCDFDGVP